MGHCVQCGRRLHAEIAACSTHGPRAITSHSSDVIASIALPCIPGYQIRRVVGVGGFGAVFEANDERAGRRVAIKVCRVDELIARERFAREAVALNSIGSPHVPEIYDVGTLPTGAPFLVMEFLSLPTLADQLQTHGPMPIEVFVPLAFAI